MPRMPYIANFPAALLLMLLTCGSVGSEQTLEASQRVYLQRLSGYIGSIDRNLVLVKTNISYLQRLRNEKPRIANNNKPGTDTDVLQAEPIILDERICLTGRSPRYPELSPEEIAQRLRRMDEDIEALKRDLNQQVMEEVKKPIEKSHAAGGG